MARELLPVTFTIRPEQRRYIKNQAKTARDSSRWVREAIDMRIERELKALRTIQRRRDAFTRKNKRHGAVDVREDSLPIGPTILDAGATVEGESEERILHPDRDVPL